MSPLNTDEIRCKVEMLAASILAKAGVDLVELSVGVYKEDVIIRFAADLPRLRRGLPAGGITIGQCASLNHAIVEAIDANGFLGEQGYSLEFSSPGLDRPLVTAKDFGRNLDRVIHFWLKEPVEGKTEHRGVLVTVSNGTLVVQIRKNREITLTLGQIVKATLII